MKRMLLFLLTAVAALITAPAYGSHSLQCDLTLLPSGSVQTQLSGRSNQTVCLSKGSYKDSDGRIQLSGMNHVTVRNVPGEYVTLKGQLRLSSSVNDVLFYGFVSDDSLNVSGSETSHYIAGGDRITFDRMSVTNRGTNGSCFHTSNADPSQDVEIRYSRVFHCGFDGEHDHNIYLGKGIRWSVHDNWIYEGASRNLATHSASQDAQVYRNVFAQGCRNQGVPAGAGCSASVLFSENATRAHVHDNTIAHVRNGRWNVDEWNLAGTGNRFEDNCLWTPSGDPRVGIDWDVRTTTADPLFNTHPQWGFEGFQMGQRNYRIPSISECDGKEPNGPVGAPGP